VPKTVGLPIAKDYASSMTRKKNLFFILRVSYQLSYMISAFPSVFDNSPLFADETAISNLEFILFRHPPPPPQHPSCYILSRVQWDGNIVLELSASKKNYNLKI